MSVRRFASTLTAALVAIVIVCCPAASVTGAEIVVQFCQRPVAGIANVAKAVEITLLIDPNSKTIADVHTQPQEMNVFYRTERTYQQL